MCHVQNYTSLNSISTYVDACTNWIICVLYGTEHQVGGSIKPSGLDNSNNKDVPCAVCRRRGKSSVLMIPGKSK